MSKTNIEILDDCVDGNVDMLKNLISDDHTKFTKFCKIYRDLFGEMKELVSYNRDESSGVFSVVIPDNNMTENIKNNIDNLSNINYIQTNEGVLINISVT